MQHKNIWLRNSLISGAALIEFALISPIFLIMLFALIEFGSVLHYKQIITHASREGARLLAQQGISINQAKKIVIENLTDNGFNEKKIILSGYDSDPACSTKTSTVSMAIKIPIEDVLITGDPFNFFSKTKYLEAKITMNKECMKNYAKK